MFSEPKKRSFFSLLYALALAACASEPGVNQNTRSAETPSAAAPATGGQAAPVLEIQPLAGDAASVVTGRAVFEGASPTPKLSAVKSFAECAIHHKGGVYTEDVLVKDGGLKNVFVYVKSGLEGKNFGAPSGPAVIDQVGCIYTPHVVGIQTNQPLVIKNSDASLHNVHSRPVKQKSFNVGMPVQGMKITKSFDTPEVMVPLTCDVHPWMKAYVGVVPHPFFAVSDANGNFSLEGLPAGRYTLEAWHEVYGTQTLDITLAASESKAIGISFTTP